MGGGYGTNLSTKYTVNFFGTEDSALILDGSSFSYGLNSALKSLTVNTRHTEIKNFNTLNNMPLLNCSTFNVYEGTKIYDNKTTGSLYVGTTLNLHGGEIYNNTSTAIIMFDLKNVNMFGGSIHNNYLTSTTATGFMVFEYGNENVYRFFDGSIYSNYIQADNSPAFISSSKWNAKSMINLACVGENYYYSSTDDTVEPTIVKNFNNLSYGDISYAVIFKDGNGALLSAYAMHKGPYATSYSLVDSTGTAVSSITIPEGYKWTNKYNYCVEVTPNTTAQGTYYALGEHKYENDFDCTTALACIACKMITVEAQEHNFATVISYPNGYTVIGEKATVCTHEDCVSANTVTDANALFISKGYSKDTTSSAIVLNIKIDNQAISEYEAYLKMVDENATILYGVVAAINTTDDKPLNDDATAKAGSLAIKFNENNYSNIQIKITGIDATNYETGIYCSGYVYVNNQVTYINGATASDTATKVTYASLPTEE